MITDRMVEAAMEQWMAATGDVPPDDPGRALMRAAIEAALREQQAEPVAWRCHDMENQCYEYVTDSPRVRKQYPAWSPLYANPPQKRTPLTDEE